MNILGIQLKPLPSLINTTFYLTFKNKINEEVLYFSGVDIQLLL